jgi:hypothetical protein
MPDAIELENEAGKANSEGHHCSFAAHRARVDGDERGQHDRLSQAAAYYSLAAHFYAEAAVEHLSSSRAAGPEDRLRQRDLAKADCGRAAADRWYAGRAYADAFEFEAAGREMGAAAGDYVAESRLREEDGETGEAITLRRMANFRYLDAQRYFLQAAATERELADELRNSGQNAAADQAVARTTEAEAQAAIAEKNAQAEAPRYHAGYEQAYR